MALNADDDNFSLYSSGIYNPSASDCGEYPNHTILAVGYGFDVGSGTEYFIILNSWATDWGENGYAKTAVGISGNSDCGMCGMFCDWQSYPTMSTVSFSEDEWLGDSAVWNDISDGTGAGCPKVQLRLSGKTTDSYDVLDSTIK